jgi:glycosyltransferase involved in cell wall biosynthesis
VKILNVNMSLDPVAGAGTAERTFQMSRYLARAGMDCTVLTMDTGMTLEHRQSLAPVRVVALPVVSRRFYIPRVKNGAIMELVGDADIVHLMNHWTLLNALVYRAVRRLGKPYVVCPAGSLPIFGRSRMIKKMYRLVVGDAIIRRASGHIAVTADEKAHFSDYGISPDRVSIIPNGISEEAGLESDPEAFRRAAGLGQVPFILFMGRLNAIKGPDLLLHAFGLNRDVMRDVHLVFVGPDEGLLPDLQRMTREYGLSDRVHFPGYLGGRDKIGAYQAASILAVPSRQEAMSIVALEAGINGVPVLLTDRCGFDEIDHIGGGMVVPASVEGLQAGLLNMMNLDSTKRKGMGEVLKAYVREHYLWDSVIHRYIALYRRILADKALQRTA